MKLAFWKIPGLATHHGFAFVDVVDRPGTLDVSLQNLEEPDIKVSIKFQNYIGFMICGEFGMERYIADSPARRSQGGSNFFTATESEFGTLLNRGDVNADAALAWKSFILVDADRWIE